MSNQKAKRQLLKLYEQLENKGKYGDTGYIANETAIILESAIEIIEEYEIFSAEVKLVKERVLHKLRNSFLLAKNYYNPSHGFNKATFINTKILSHTYINPAYDSLEYFISIMD